MFAWLADLLDELRADRIRHRAMRDLGRMDDAALRDIGIERDLIGTIAGGMADRHPARRRPEPRYRIGSRPVHCG